MSVKILLADDHKVMRDGLRSLIEKQPEMEVVAEAENGWTSTCPM
jgi:DNA-binding NarL/FixJ family response regulator